MSLFMLSEIQSSVQEKLNSMFNTVEWTVDNISSRAWGEPELAKPYHSTIKVPTRGVTCDVCVDDADSAAQAANLVIKRIQALKFNLTQLKMSPLTARRNSDDAGRLYIIFSCLPFDYDGTVYRYAEAERDGSQAKVVEHRHMPFTLEPFEALIHVQNISNHAQSFAGTHTEYAQSLLKLWSSHMDWMTERVIQVHAIASAVDKLRGARSQELVPILEEVLGPDYLTIHLVHDGQLVPLVDLDKGAIDVHRVFDYLLSRGMQK